MDTVPHPIARRQRGVTLVEATTVLAVTAVLVGIALPSFDQMRQRQHLEGIALQFETDVHHARSVAVARQQTVRISFASDAAASCYVLHTGAASACRCGAGGTPVCAAGAEPLRTVRLDTAREARLTSNVASMAFDPVRGTVTPTGTVTVATANGRALKQTVNIMGRVRSCSPDGAVLGYRAC
jgi:type IV fimbrial biogenesis protein FimT